jgi:CubicO group peptidase (beta-lactamase class C family)
MDVLPLPAAIVDVISEEMAREQVPGLSAAVVHNGQVYAGGFGVTNVLHPLPVTPDTLFRIGSTSKTFTATALMQLVEAGEVELEAPVRRYIPDFRLQSEPDAAALLVRHVVSHHAGFVGDYFRDCGRGDDARTLIVAKMARSPQIIPAGTAFSYSNAALYVAGRIIEIVTGGVFEDVITERILRPLELDHTTYWLEQAMVHRFALGHVPGRTGPEPVKTYMTNRAIAPASNVIASALDQVRYAAFHLGDGTAPSGERLLKAETLRYMQSPLWPGGSVCDAVGISWEIDHLFGGVDIVKHGGSIGGQLSAFEMVPQRSYGCTVLTNSESGRGPRQVVADAARRHFLSLDETPAPLVTLPTDLLDACCGRYVGAIFDVRVTRQGDGLVVFDESPIRTADGARVAPDALPLRLGFTAPGRARILDQPRPGERCEFNLEPGGHASWMRWDGRVCPRAE